jgi:hypothetical protein
MDITSNNLILCIKVFTLLEIEITYSPRQCQVSYCQKEVEIKYR